MRRTTLLCLLLLLLLPALTLSACAGEAIPLSEIDAEGSYEITLTHVKRLYPAYDNGKSSYHIQQGCATDGQYAYFAAISNMAELAALWKVNIADWSVVETVYGLPLDHANDMAYNPKLGRLLVANNKPNYTTLTLVDPETLQITGTVTPGDRIYAVAYNESRDQYVIGLSGTYNFAILDSDFKIKAYCKGIDTGMTKQGMDCDDTYIYFPQWNSSASENTLVVYDWEGNYINTLPVRSVFEIESLFHIGEDVYIAFNTNGTRVYKAQVERK